MPGDDPNRKSTPLGRVGGRVLDALARRVSERLQPGIAEALKNAAPPVVEKCGFAITIDYPVQPRPRWGERWGLPAHGRLLELVRSADVETRAVLASIAGQRDALRRIDLHAPAGSAEPEWVNDWLPGLDGSALYAFVAARNPATYLEVGSGNSTKFVRRAIRDHGLRTRIVSIDPHPRAEVDAICDEVVRRPLEDCDLAVFARLVAGDVCFVDNSHRSFQNSDVTVSFLEVLPALTAGVRVGFHDIFLPDDYPEAWAGRYYSEQYLLAAYLLGGHRGTRIVLPAWDASQRAELADIVAPIWDGEAFAPVQRHGAAFWLETLA